MMIFIDGIYIGTILMFIAEINVRNCASRLCWLMEFLREVNHKGESDIFSLYMNICMGMNGWLYECIHVYERTNVYVDMNEYCMTYVCVRMHDDYYLNIIV